MSIMISLEKHQGYSLLRQPPFQLNNDARWRKAALHLFHTGQLPQAPWLETHVLTCLNVGISQPRDTYGRVKMQH